jgi:transposase
MEKKLKKREAELKLKVALEALKGELSISQIASKYDIHPKQVTDWRDQLLQEGELVFTPKTSLRRTKTDHEKEDLLLKIGQLTVENDYLKKKLNYKGLQNEKE